MAKARSRLIQKRKAMKDLSWAVVEYFDQRRTEGAGLPGELIAV
jgi:hypothetical protein